MNKQIELKRGELVDLLNQEQAELQKNMQIEELVGDIAKGINGVLVCEIINLAEHLTSLGYQKVGKDSVVLTKEDLKHYAKDCIIGELAGLDILNGLIERAKRKEKEARKETAREILNEFLKEFVVYTCVGDYYTDTEINNKIQELAKQFGVEIKE